MIGRRLLAFRRPKRARGAAPAAREPGRLLEPIIGGDKNLARLIAYSYVEGWGQTRSMWAEDEDALQLAVGNAAAEFALATVRSLLQHGGAGELNLDAAHAAALGTRR